MVQVNSKHSNQALSNLPNNLNPFRIFKAECPNCQMKKEKVTEFYQLIMPNENAESFVEEIFQNFDNDSNGFLDFQVLSVQNLGDGGQF